jgi:nitrite reductase/ring-hydroxylating ferredoxin subunit
MASDQLITHSEEQSQEEPIWDEASSRFWCRTSVNAYDIPDGFEWQRGFRKALAIHEPKALAAHGLWSPQLSSIPSPCRPPRMALTPSTDLFNETESPPTTPRRLPRRGTRDSPKTPPLKIGQDFSEKRGARAAHTKALLSMRQNAGVPVLIQGRELALFRFDGRVFAVAARCPHQGGNLCEGEVGDIEDLVDDNSGAGHQHAYVTCPVHKMQFDLRDGKVMQGNCKPLKTYDARVTEVDEERKFAPVEVALDGLADEYFGGGKLQF